MSRVFVGRRNGWVVVQAAMWVLLLSGTAWAQIRVEGVVRDAAGTPIANATVQLTTQKQETVTDTDGRYHFDGVRPGQYIELAVLVSGKKILEAYRLVTSAVEQIDIGGTPAGVAKLIEPAARGGRSADGSTVTEQSRPPLTAARRKELGVGGSGGIRGVVRSTDGLALPGAVVAVDGTDAFATTDTDGKFTLVNLRPGARVALLVSASGFDDVRKDVEVRAGAPDTIELTLNVATQGEFVTVSADVPMLKISSDTSHVTLRPEQIASLPSLGEKDLFRAIQLLPGVTGTQEASSGLYVRGGTPDQNLVSLDGFTLYHVDHLFGYFSAFNMDAIDKVEFSKSAFDAADGGRLSGVLRMTGRSKAAPKPTGFVDVSALSVSGLYSSPLGSRGSFLIAGRRSFQSPLYNNILGLFSNNGAAGFGRPGGGGPSPFGGSGFSSTPASWFYDVNAKAEFKLTAHDTFSMSGYDGRDDLDNSRTLEIGKFTGGLPAPSGVTVPTIPSDLVLGISDLRNVTNRGGGATLRHDWGRNATTTLVAGWSKFTSNRAQANSLTLSSTGEDYAIDSGRGGSGAQAETNALRDLTMRFDNRVPVGRSHQLSFGAEATSLDASYSAETEAVQSNGPGGFRSGLVGLLAQSGRGQLLTGYLQDTWNPTARLVITGGLRATKYDVTNEVFFEPRMRANLQLTSRVQLKAGYGGYHQAVNRIAQEDLSQGDREFWLLSNGTNVPVSSAQQFAGGFSYETPGFLVDAEAYHKRLQDLTLFAPRLTPGVVPSDGDTYLYYGSGLAYGLEVLTQKKFGTHTGWISYSLSRVEQTFPLLETSSFPAAQDQTHEVKVADSIKLSEAWTMGASWIFGSGKPYTPATGVESVTLPIGVTVDRLTYGAKNSARLPTYHRLDLSTQGDVRFFGMKGTIGLTVFNVYDRQNVWYRTYQTFGGSGSVNDVTLMGRAINVFLKVGF